MNGDRLRKQFGALLVHVALVTGAVFVLFPFVWMLLGSFKSYNDATTSGFLPREWLWSNYADAIVTMNGSVPCQFNAADPLAMLDQCLLLRYFANTLFVGVVVVLGVITTGVLAGYAFARLNFPGRNLLFGILLATLMIPFELTLVPNFVFMTWFPTPESWLATLLGISREGVHNWINTYYALIVPFTASVFSIFLFRQFFRGIPNELFDAALLDGATHSRYLWSVVLPLSKPALVTSGLLTFLGTWNALMWPLLVTNAPQMRPIQVGLSQFIGEAGTQVQLLMAGATLTVLPIMVLYLILQKWFVEGISSAGIRG